MMIPTHPGLTAIPTAANSPPGADIEANAAIEQTVRAMLAESPVSKTAYITVAVHAGVVTLEGIVSDGLWLARFKNKLTSALPSVTIEDRLEWVVPDCSVGIA